MMKLKQLLKEEELGNALIKVLNIMLKMGFDPEDVSDNYIKLKSDLHITDSELRGNATLYYKKYHGIAEERGSFKDLGDVNIDYDEDDIEDEIMALAQFLDTHPFFIEDTGYSEYRDILTDNEYRVLDEDSADSEFRERAEEYIDDVLDYSDSDLGWLEYYLEIDRYSVEQFCEEEADYYVDDLDSEDIIDQMNEEDELERRLTEAREKSDRWYELDETIDDVKDKISDVTSDIEDLNEEMYEIRTEKSSAQSQEEIDDLEIQYEELEEQMIKLQEGLEYWEEQLEVLESEFEELDSDIDEDDIKDQLADELKEDLKEKYASDKYDEIEYEGWQWFKSNLGYTAKQVLDNGLFDIDREGAIDSLESDRGNIMNSYDGTEEEEYYNGQTFYIYQTN